MRSPQWTGKMSTMDRQNVHNGPANCPQWTGKMSTMDRQIVHNGLAKCPFGGGHAIRRVCHWNRTPIDTNIHGAALVWWLSKLGTAAQRQHPFNGNCVCDSRHGGSSEVYPDISATYWPSQVNRGPVSRVRNRPATTTIFLSWFS